MTEIDKISCSIQATPQRRLELRNVASCPESLGYGRIHHQQFNHDKGHIQILTLHFLFPLICRFR